MTTHPSTARAVAAGLTALVVSATALLALSNPAGGAVVATVPMGTAADYSVLGATTVTNTGNSVLRGSLGLWPGSSITGFPPGDVVPPATTNRTNSEAQQAKSDLTSAYLDTAGRTVTATTGVELGSRTLGAGVYAGSAKSPLGITGPLVLDGGGDVTSVFIFQTDSTLTTASGSTVTLTNGAQECNVFWQVGSSATLGTGSTFAGTILALTSITVTTGVTVRGRALARNGAVTLDSDTFTRPTCAQPSVATTTTTTAAGTATTTTTTPGGDISTTDLGRDAPGTAAPRPVPGRTTSTPRRLTEIGLTTGGPARPRIPGVVGPPRTGAAPSGTGGSPWPAVLAAGLGGAVAAAFVRRHRMASTGAKPTGR